MENSDIFTKRMKNYLKYPYNIIKYKSFRKFSWPKSLPINITLSITSKCNSRCKTCNIWKNPCKKELGLRDWQKILKSIGKSPLWITISGGEPFLRKDFVGIVRYIQKYNNPNIITIGTNGILTNKITNDIKKVLSFYNRNLIINLSLDGIGHEHDFIRGTKCFDKVLKTYKKLKEFNNLFLGFHTVISKYNVNKINKIYNFVEGLKPDSFICEIAENRKELKNTTDNIAPSFEEYSNVVGFLLNIQRKTRGISKLIQLLRKKYYQLTLDTAKKKKAILPCYAGIASAHINYNGDLWSCCVKCDCFGNLKENDFKDLWSNERANMIRARIKNEKCYCTLANVYYSNFICNLI